MAKLKKKQRIAKEDHNKEVRAYKNMYLGRNNELGTIPKEIRVLLKEIGVVNLRPKVSGLKIIIYVDGTYLLEFFEEASIFDKIRKSKGYKYV